MFNPTMFTVDAPITPFMYDGKERSGTVIEVAVCWIRVDVGNGFRTFRYENMKPVQQN